MRSALGELDPNTPIANRRSPRACVLRAGEETPARAHDVGVGSGDAPTSTRRRNMAALDAAEALLRGNYRESPSRYADDHLTYAEALKQSGYIGTHGVVVLSKRLGAARGREELGLVANSLVDMSQTPGGTQEIAEGVHEESDDQPRAASSGRKGNSGRRKLTPEERERAELVRRSVHGFQTFGDYAAAVLEAVEYIRETETGSKTALARTLVESQFSRLGVAALTPKYLVALASDDDFSELRRRGGPIFTVEEENILADKVRTKREHFMAVRPKEVMRWANEILQLDAQRWEQTAGEGVTRGWYNGFARRNGFKITSKKNLDIVRARWSTSANASKFYDVLCEGALALRAAEALDNVSLAEEGASQLCFLYLQLVVSMDETAVSLSPDATHTNGQAVISAGPRDCGETLHSKGLPGNTLVYARNGAGQLLPSMVVCGGHKHLPDDFSRVDLLANPSRVSDELNDDDPALPPNVVDLEGVPLKTHWTANMKSSLNGTLIMEWANICLLPALKACGLSAEKPAILLYDGVQTHVSLEFIETLREQNVHVFLRTPHMTALLQGEDTVVFPVLKAHFNACVDELVAERNASTEDNHLLQELVWTDLPEVLRNTFARLNVLKLNLDAWAAEGVIPFDRRIAVQLALDEAEQAEAAAERMIRSLTVSRVPVIRDENALNTLSSRYLLPRFSLKAQNSLRASLRGLDDAATLQPRFDALVEQGKFADATEHDFVVEALGKLSHTRENIESWLSTSARTPRASDVWDLPGGLCGEAAMRLMRAARDANEQRQQQRPDDRRRARGPRGGSLEEYSIAGDAIMSDLLSKPPGERDYRTLAKKDLEKLYVLLVNDWFPAQMSRAWFVEVLKDLIEAQYPEVLFMDAPEPEIQPGSPMSQLGDVTESESLGEPDADIASEAAADVSMAERSMSDIRV